MVLSFFGPWFFGKFFGEFFDQPPGGLGRANG